MTSALPKSTLVGVNTPLSNYAELQNPYKAVLVGNEEFNARRITTTSYSTSGITFSSITVNNEETFVDRNIILNVSYSFIGSAIPAIIGQRPLQTGFDAPRAMALNKSIDANNFSINGTTFTSRPTDYIQELMRFNRTDQEVAIDFSASAPMLDNSQEYAETANTNRNPLARWGDNSSVFPRGAVVLTNVVNPQSVDLVTPVAFSFDLVLREPLAMSPCLQNMNRAVGFYGVQSMDLQVTFKNNLKRYLWSHNPANTLFFDITNIEVKDAQLEMMFASPLASEKKTNRGKEVTFPYYQIRSFVKTEAMVVAPNASAQVVAQSVPLQSIPRKAFVFVREKDSIKTMETTDAYFRIEQLSIDFGNKSSLFSSATPHQLYKMAVRNGYYGTYHDWYAALTYESIGANEGYTTGVGSIAAFSFGSDIPLGSDMSVGMEGQYKFQPTITVRNMNQSRAMIPEIVILIVHEGSFSIYKGDTSVSVAGVTHQDLSKVLTTPKNRIPFEQYTTDIIGGSKVGDWFKKAGKSFWDVFKHVAPLALPILAKFAMGGGVVPKTTKKTGGGVGIIGGKKMSKTEFMRSVRV